jgi:hypothetical protein
MHPWLVQAGQRYPPASIIGAQQPGDLRGHYQDLGLAGHKNAHMMSTRFAE